MMDMSTRSSGKFSQSIQCLLLEHWKGKCMTETSTFTTDAFQTSCKPDIIQNCIFVSSQQEKYAENLQISGMLSNNPHFSIKCLLTEILL